MTVARAGVLGVRWLQRASRNMVPLGAWRASHFTKDMLPGPYPRTPEQAAAAKKYNMCVEYYKPSPDDGMGYGDYYPKLPDHSQQERDPWDDMCRQLFGFVVFIMFMFWVGHNYPVYQPVAPKQYPYNDLYPE
ncbi:NADH dehydrogenase [ubiquinone] 1 beta subcomplex subunit 8, mitochondrial [Plecturocebus cupreus]